MEILMQLQASSARAVCTSFCKHFDSQCTAVTLRWPDAGIQMALEGFRQMLQRLPALDRISCNECPANGLPVLGLPLIQRLDLGMCSSITTLGPLSSCRSLTGLSMTGCRQLIDVDAIAACTNMRQLCLRGCHKLNSIRPLCALAHLLYLEVSQCPILSDIWPLTDCHALQVLNLSRCSSISDTSPLGYCSSLTRLNMKGCMQLSHIRHVPGVCDPGEVLALSGYVNKINPLAKCLRLQELDLSECTFLRDTRPLMRCMSLRVLTIGPFYLPDGLLNLAACSRLTSLDIRTPWNADTSMLMACTALTRLVVNGSHRLGLAAG